MGLFIIGTGKFLKSNETPTASSSEGRREMVAGRM
jgi:hypothetical protein